MSDHDHARQRIITSVFDKRNAGAAVQESYVAHVKIWEDTGEGQEQKPRYILLSRASDGTGFIHKSKLNTNGSFSVGKTWKLAELRGIELIDPLSFSITLARTYKWRTENRVDQSAFVHTLCELFHELIGGPLQLVGMSSRKHSPALPGICSFMISVAAKQGARDVDVSSHLRPSSNVSSSGRRTPIPGASHVSQTGPERPQTPISQTPTRSYMSSSSPRPTSPADSSRGPVVHAMVAQNAVNKRPPSPSISQQQPQSTLSNLPSALRPRNIPRPPNTMPPVSLSTSVVPIPTNIIPARQQISAPSSRLSQEVASSNRPSLDLGRTSTASSVPVTTPALHPPPRVESPVPEHATSRVDTPKLPGAPHPRREHANRISFFDPANQVSIGRLVAGDLGEEGEDQALEDDSQATMLSVEEMLEGYDWASDDMFGRKSTRGAADLVEARLLDELMALEKANIHSFLESDDRVNFVIKYLDEALTEVDAIDSLLSSYKIHLNAVGDDISFIQSQRRGLQVHTQNQRALLHELENLVQTVQVNRETLVILTQESLEKPASIQKLEEAATELYKALQASQDTGNCHDSLFMIMTLIDKQKWLQRWKGWMSTELTIRSSASAYLITFRSWWLLRQVQCLFPPFLNEKLNIIQAKIILESNNGVNRASIRSRPTIVDHQSMETYLGRYAGLVLYLKEMDETVYSKLCGVYFSAASDLHSKQMKMFLSIYNGLLKKPPEEDGEQSFGGTTNTTKGGAIRRAGTIVRTPMETQKRDRDKKRDDEYQPSEALGYILEEIASRINHESDFIADFLQINDTGLTFADYAGLENYFRRQAARSAGLTQSTMKLVRGAMDLIFGFLPQEIKQWIDNAITKDTLQVIGIIAGLERYLAEMEERGNTFLFQMLDKQLLRLRGTFDRHVNQQIKMVEETKLTSKKRKGVAQFVKYFPVYVNRAEQQLVGADGLEIRASVDLAYEKIVHSMFECLKHMATLDGDGEDKGQLNYHVLLVENMHYFVAEMSRLRVGSMARFSKQAESIYNENLIPLIVYPVDGVHLQDFFDGLERLLKTTAPSQVQKNSNYSKSTLKRVLKEFDVKDVRKHVDVLFRRVEKHFTEAEENTTREESSGITPGTVLVGVWKACEEELQKMTESFSARISQCYPDSGLSLDYSSSDIEATFRRHQHA
ncbi:hypothetical protein ID866_1152 [Astraeus odoratus]|nr:hypothetical protein ID866_1152 [Astraeus odoratus]